MAISFVGSHVGTHALTVARTVNFSTLLDAANTVPTLAQGDIVFVAVENASTVDRTQAQLTPSGYTPAHTDDYRNDSNDSNFLVSYKVMGATPDTSVAIPASNATTAGVAYAIYVFRGVDTANPFDATPVPTGAINTGVANAAAIVPNTAGAWVVAFAGAAVAAGAVFTRPTNMDATTNYFRSATITTTTNDANIAGAIYAGWTSGSFDPNAFGGSTTTNTGSWSAVTLALKPYIEPAVGSLSVTESGSDTAALAGTVSDPAITGTLAGTETGTDTASIVGDVSTAPITGALAASEGGSDGFSGSGAVTVAGSASAIEIGSDTMSAIGGPVVGGALAAVSSGADVAAASGGVGVAGALAANDNGADTADFAGSLSVIGQLSAVETGSDLATASGIVIDGGSGAMDAREVAGSDHFAGTGKVLMFILGTTPRASASAPIRRLGANAPRARVAISRRR
jgi:hypothetical protein